MARFFKSIYNSIKYWYLILFSGILFILLGLYVISQPLESYVTLAFIFSLAFILTGIFEIIFAVSNREELEGWGWQFSLGLLNLVIGVLMMMYPDIPLASLPFFVGFVVMFRSIYAIAFSMELKNYYILDWGNLMVVGVLGLIFSFILLWNPIFAGMSLVVWTGIGFITIGGFSIYYSLKLKKLKDIPKKISHELKDRFENLKKEIQEEIERAESTGSEA